MDYSSLGLICTVEFSAGLSSWAASAATPVSIANDGTIEAVSVPYPAILGGEPASFFRVRVTMP